MCGRNEVRRDYIPPFQGLFSLTNVTQGAALGWYILPLRGEESAVSPSVPSGRRTRCPDHIPVGAITATARSTILAEEPHLSVLLRRLLFFFSTIVAQECS